MFLPKISNIHISFLLLCIMYSALAFDCTTLKDNTSCAAVKECAWCEPLWIDGTGKCYDAASGACCGQGGFECRYFALCNATSSCCMPSFDCNWNGLPDCCVAGTTCCPARHQISCCSATQKCCNPSLTWPTCCGIRDVCCGNSTMQPPWCCPEGSACGNFNCISKG